MLTAVKISLTIPDLNTSGKYFSIYLRDRISHEDANFKKINRITVIDGNFDSFRMFCSILIKKKITDNKLNWIFSDGHLVVMSNGLLPKDQLISYWWLLYSLQGQAIGHGGYLHFLINNDNLFNLDDSWRLSHPNYAIKKNDTKNNSAALYYGNTELWHWLNTKNRIEKIGEFLFAEDDFLFKTEALDFGNDQRVAKLLNQHKVRKIILGSALTEEITSCFEGKQINIPKGKVGSRPGILHIKGKHCYRSGITHRKEQLK